MSILKNLVLSAGQKVHEDFFQAQLVIYGGTIPCTSSRVRDDWVLASGLSPKLFIESICFFRANLAAEFQDKTRKGVNFTLLLNPAATPIDLKLWDGGLKPDGLVFEFSAVDRNFGA